MIASFLIISFVLSSPIYSAYIYTLSETQIKFLLFYIASLTFALTMYMYQIKDQNDAKIALANRRSIAALAVVHVVFLS
jgi:hypothetical protein